MTIALKTLTGTTPSKTFYTLLEDPNGVVSGYIEKYHTASLSRILCENAATVVNRGNKTIIHNYAQMPTPKINQIVIPTGATRWSHGLLLADDTTKSDIYAACNYGADPLSLVFSSTIGEEDESKSTITLTVWCLPPRRVSPETNNEDVVNLWMIPIVDERYWWQFQHVDKLSEVVVSAEITDVEMLQLQLTDMTNATRINVNPKAVFSILPSFAKLNDYENLPIMIDTANAHAGQRTVIIINSESETGRNKFASISGIDSITTLDANLQGTIGLPTPNITVGTPYLVAGGKATSAGGYIDTNDYTSAPQSVDIQTTEGVYTNKTAAEASPTYRYKTGVIGAWRTCYDETPGSELIAQTNKDYYFQFSHQFDYTFAGVQPWQQGYFDDYMVLTQNWNPKTQCYSTFTRVCSRPPNLHGEWTQPGNGSGVGERDCWATVEEVVCDPYGRDEEMYVLAKVDWFTGKDCNSTVPGVDSYGRIEVHQICNIFTAYYTAEDLVGKIIRATYMFPQDGSTSEAAGECSFVWDGFGWVLFSDGCTSGKPVEPAFDGTEIGETANGTCGVTDPQDAACKPKWLCDAVCGAPECS